MARDLNHPVLEATIRNEISAILLFGKKFQLDYVLML